jgi:hypothetical protein
MLRPFFVAPFNRWFRLGSTPLTSRRSATSAIRLYQKEILSYFFEAINYMKQTTEISSAAKNLSFLTGQ